jgi:hypothetical protein
LHKELLRLKTVKTKFFCSKYVLKCDLKPEKLQKELKAPIKTRAREL